MSPYDHERDQVDAAIEQTARRICPLDDTGVGFAICRLDLMLQNGLINRVQYESQRKSLEAWAV